MHKTTENCQKSHKLEKAENFSHSEKISHRVLAWHYLKNDCKNSGQKIQCDVYLRRYQFGPYDQAMIVCPECGEIIGHCNWIARDCQYRALFVPDTWTLAKSDYQSYHPNWAGCPGAGLLVFGLLYRRVLGHEQYDEGHVVCPICGMEIDFERICKDSSLTHEIGAKNDEFKRIERAAKIDRQKKLACLLPVGADGLPF